MTECTVCPDWVDACIHYEDHWLALHRDSPDTYYVVCIGSGTPLTRLRLVHVGARRVRKGTLDQCTTFMHEFDLPALVLDLPLFGIVREGSGNGHP